LILKKVIIENIRSHKYLEFEPASIGVTAISGENGAGKSTIVDAFSWSLFGTRLHGLRNKNYIREGVDAKEETVQVTSYIRVGNTDFMIRRKITSNEGACECKVFSYNEEIGDWEFESGPAVTHAESFIRSVLNIDEKGFLSSVFIQQKQVDQIVSASPTERGQVIEKLIGVSAITESTKLAREESRALQRAADIIQPGSLEDEKEKVEESEDVKKEISKEKSKSKKTEKEDKRDKKAEKKPVKEKPVKPKIPGVHIWRAISILFLSLLLLVVSAYLLSPYATMKDIRVEGTVQTTADDIRQASGIQDSDYTINLLLDKAKYEEQIKSNYWVESAQLVYQFPTKFTIKVKEYDIVAYYVSGENHYPIISSGQLETSSVSLVSLPETYISVLFNDSEQIKAFVSELAQISPELKADIQKVELAPSKVTSDLIRLTMNDSDEVLVPLSEMSKKLPYYSKIKPQLSEPSVIDMEAGIYSYTVADKLIMEAEEKAKQEAKEAAKKLGIKMKIVPVKTAQEAIDYLKKTK